MPKGLRVPPSTEPPPIACPRIRMSIQKAWVDAMRSFSHRQMTDRGQGALIMVMSMAMVISILGAGLITATLSTGSTVESNLIQRYAYRALESGENAYTN